MNGGEDKFNWARSREKCQESKGDLAAFNEKEENKQYFARKGFGGYWFGFYWIPGKYIASYKLLCYFTSINGKM